MEEDDYILCFFFFVDSHYSVYGRAPLHKVKVGFILHAHFVSHAHSMWLSGAIPLHFFWMQTVWQPTRWHVNVGTVIMSNKTFRSFRSRRRSFFFFHSYFYSCVSDLISSAGTGRTPRALIVGYVAQRLHKADSYSFEGSIALEITCSAGM